MQACEALFVNNALTWKLPKSGLTLMKYGHSDKGCVFPAEFGLLKTGVTSVIILATIFNVTCGNSLRTFNYTPIMRASPIEFIY